MDRMNAGKSMLSRAWRTARALGLGAGIVFGASAAEARASVVAVEPQVGHPLDHVALKAIYFWGGERIEVRFDHHLLLVGTSGRDGSFSRLLTIPGWARPGEHVVQINGIASRRVARCGFVVQTDWLQFHGSASRSGVNVHENVLAPANVGRLSLGWSTRLGNAVPGSPVVADGSIYCGTEDGSLHAVDASTGRIEWSYRIASPIYCSPAVIKGFNPQPDPPGKQRRRIGTVVVGASRGLYAFDHKTGFLLWTADVGEVTQSPLVIDPSEGAISDVNEGPVAIVAATVGGVVFSIDGFGRRQWSAPLDGSPISGSPCAFSDANEFTMRYESLVFVPTEGGCVHALSVASGTTAWKTALDGKPGTIALGGPDTTNPLLYVGTERGTLYAMESLTGRVRWTYGVGAAIEGAPAIGDGNAYSADAVVYLGAADGSIFGISDVNDRPTVLWSTTAGGGIHTSPALANGVVYCGADDGVLRALDARTGRVLFASTSLALGRSSPAVVDGMVLFGTELGEIAMLQVP